MRLSSIEWTHHTFNPWIGCERVSPGCRECYAAEWDRRFYGGEHWGPSSPRKSVREDYWRQPETWNRQALARGVRERVFCASLGGVFEDRPGLEALRARLWTLIRATPALDWLLLTKRPENLRRLLPPDWGTGWRNVWLGTSVESGRYLGRVQHLLQAPAVLRFLSLEPLLGPLPDLASHLRARWQCSGCRLCYAGPYRDLCECGRRGYWTGSISPDAFRSEIHWLIVGGESGRRARPVQMGWIAEAMAAGLAKGVPVFVKQLGHHAAHGSERLALADAKGGDLAEWPPALRVRQIPEVAA